MEDNYIAPSTAMRERVGVCELLKEVYSIVLKYYKLHTTYRKIFKTFGKNPQSIVHEDNSACLKFVTVPKIYLWTKDISIPDHFLQTNIENVGIKIAAISTDNQLANKFTKGLPDQRFLLRSLNYYEVIKDKTH